MAVSSPMEKFLPYEPNLQICVTNFFYLVQARFAVKKHYPAAHWWSGCYLQYLTEAEQNFNRQNYSTMAWRHSTLTTHALTPVQDQTWLYSAAPAFLTVYGKYLANLLVSSLLAQILLRKSRRRSKTGPCFSISCSFMIIPVGAEKPSIFRLLDAELFHQTGATTATYRKDVTELYCNTASSAGMVYLNRSTTKTYTDVTLLPFHPTTINDYYCSTLVHVQRHSFDGVLALSLTQHCCCCPRVQGTSGQTMGVNRNLVAIVTS